jgi:hypothetical protein
MVGMMFSNILVAQTESNTSSFPRDSIFNFQGIKLNLNYKFDNLIHYNNPDFFPNNMQDYNNPSTIWLRTELELSSSLPIQKKTGTNRHFTSTLYQQYLEESKFDPVRYLLGIAQIGAVGYLTYKHIKKYGFWK